MKSSYLKHILTVAVLVGLGLAAYKYLNGAEVMAALRSFDYIYAPFMLALSAAYLLLKAWRFVFLTRPLTNLAWGIIFKAFVAGQAATLLPGGVAARAGLMHQVGMPVSRSSVPVGLSSLLDQVVFILGSLVAALWFEYARTPALIILGVLLVVAAVFIVPTSRRKLAHLADWTAGKFHARQQWHHFLDAVPRVVTLRTMLITMGITLVAFAIRIFVLHFSMLGVGLSLSYPALFLAYILPTMLGRIFPLPGGVGVTEAGMVGFISSTAGTDINTTAAAVAIFRVVTVVYEALLGALVYFFAWQGEKEVAREEEATSSASS